MRCLISILIFSIFIIGCRPLKFQTSNNQTDVYQITKTDTIKDVLIVYAIKNDTIYKMLTLVNSVKFNPISVGSKYRLGIKSLFYKGLHLVTDDGTLLNVDLTPEAIHGLSGTEYHKISISIDTEIPNEKLDLFEIMSVERM
jgi:hypothetical protein